MGNTKREKLIKLLEKIQSTNDFECLKIYCSDLYDSIKNSDFKNKYQENVNKFFEYSISDEYEKDYKLLIKKLSENYNNVESVFNESRCHILNIDIENIKNIDSGNGLIKAYLYICQDVIDHAFDEMFFNSYFYLVDYALFEIMANSNFVNDYDCLFGEVLIHNYLNNNPKSFNIINIITIKILKDYLICISNNKNMHDDPTGIVAKLKRKIDKKIQNKEMKIEIAEIKELLTKKFKTEADCRKQCQNYIGKVKKYYETLKFEPKKYGYSIEEKS